MKCNLVLEGGGVKGLAHIGALKAIQDYQIRLGNVAGTSAGAIAAALYAAGYTPDQMYNPKTGTGIFPNDLTKILLGKKLDQFRAYGFLGILTIYTLAPLLIILSHISIFTIGYTIFFSLMLLSLAKRSAVIKSILSMTIILILVIFYSFLIIFSVPFFWHFGLISTAGVREWLSHALETSPALEKNKQRNHINEMTLKEFYKITKIDLKIIAADLTNQKLVAFSGRNILTEDILVLDCIIASMCIPLLFKCCDIKYKNQTSRFVDGGMLSNFPAWVHRKPLIMEDLIHTIGIKLFSESEAKKSRKEITTPSSYISSLISTALWGRSDIENISLKGLINIKINTGKITTLKFNLTPFQRNELYCEAYVQAIKHLEKDFSLFPSKKIITWLDNITEWTAEPFFMSKLFEPESCEIRSSISTYIDSDLKISKLIHTKNMDKDIDRHLEFEFGEGVSGLALSVKLPITYLPKHQEYHCLNGISLLQRQKQNLKLKKNRRALVKKNIDMIISLPLFDYDELQKKGAISSVDKSPYKNLQLIDFDIVIKKDIEPKAAFNIDISILDKSDEERKALIDVIKHSSFQILLNLTATLGAAKITELSEFKSGSSHE